MNLPILIKNMLLFLLVFGCGFSVGTICGYKSAEEVLEEELKNFMVEEEVDLGDWL